MPLSPLDRPGEWTFDDLVLLPDDGRRWEVVDGALLQVTPPTRLHDVVSKRLAFQLHGQLPGEWEVEHEFGLRLGSDGRVPDVGIARKDAPFRRDDVGLSSEHVLLLAEVVSTGSRKNDRFFKPIEYAQAGVAHYWRVETDPEIFVVTHELVDGSYQQTGVLRGSREVTAPFDLVIDVPALRPTTLGEN